MSGYFQPATLSGQKYRPVSLSRKSPKVGTASEIFDSGSTDLGCCEQAHKGFAVTTLPPPVKQTTSLIKPSHCSAAVSRRFTAFCRQDRRTVRGVGAAAGGGGRPPSRGGEARTGRSRGPRGDATGPGDRTGRHEGRRRHGIVSRKPVRLRCPQSECVVSLDDCRRRCDRGRPGGGLPYGVRAAIRAGRLFQRSAFGASGLCAGTARESPQLPGS